MILVEATPEHFGIEQDEDILYALSKCCGTRLTFNRTHKMYACMSCSKRYSTIPAVRYPDPKWAKDQYFVQTFCQLSDAEVRVHANWWVGEWLEVENLESVNVVID